MLSYASRFTSKLRTAAVLGLTGVAVALSGCAAGDVEMNGAIFDYLGMGKAAPPKAAQAADRQSLVLPPSLDRLPEPGSGAAGAGVAATQVAMPVNPESKTTANAAEQERQQTAFCDKAMQRAKLIRDVAPVQGPFGSCNPSAISGLTGSNPLQNVGGTQTVPVPTR
jgi:hypothetical protein